MSSPRHFYFGAPLKLVIFSFARELSPPPTPSSRGFLEYAGHEMGPTSALSPRLSSYTLDFDLEETARHRPRRSLQHIRFLPSRPHHPDTEHQQCPSILQYISFVMATVTIATINTIDKIGMKT